MKQANVGPILAAHLVLDVFDVLHVAAGIDGLEKDSLQHVNAHILYTFEQTGWPRHEAKEQCQAWKNGSMAAGGGSGQRPMERRM